MISALRDLFTHPWIQALAAAVTIFSGLLALLRYIQSRSLPSENRKQENHYLEGLRTYLHHLNVHTDFDEQFFVERTFRVKNEYQPRSFFIAKHKSFLSNLTLSSISQAPKEPIEGYHTKGLESEILRNNEPVIILGDPGSGKSVSSRQLAIQVATKSLHSRNPNRLLPIFLSLAEYTANDTTGLSLDFYSWLRLVLGSRSRTEVFSTEFLLEKLDEFLDSGRLLLVLDSLDEMPPSSFPERCAHLSEFMLRYSRNAFVVTCRSNDFAGSIQGREAHLDRLTSKEIKVFIHRRRSFLNDVSTKSFYRLITAPTFSLRQVIDNPFYLNLILYFFSMKGQLPDNYPLLFREICSDWVKRELKKQQIGSLASPITDSELEKETANLIKQVLSGLSAMAFAVSNSAGFGTYIDLETLKKTVLALGTPISTLNLGLRVGEHGAMLDVNNESKQARFIHHKFQEYFAAEYLSESLSSGSLKYSLLPSICDNIWWEEVTTILVNIAAKPRQIVEMLCKEDAPDFVESHFSPRFGSNLWRSRFDREVKNTFFDLGVPNESYLKEDVNKSPDDHAIDNKDTESRTIFRRNLWLAARCVQMIPRSTGEYESLVASVTETIDERLQDFLSGLTDRIDAIRALGELDTDEAVNLLTTYLHSENSLLRELSLTCLGRSDRGRRYLESHIHEVALDVYFHGKFLSRAGGYAASEWADAFPNWRSRLVIAWYSFVARVIRSRSLVAIAVSAYLWRNVIFQNPYAVTAVVVLVILETVAWLRDRETPSLRHLIAEIVVQAWLVTLIACWAMWGLFRPPWLVLPATLMMLIAYAAIPILTAALTSRFVLRHTDNLSETFRKVYKTVPGLLRKFLGREDLVVTREVELHIVRGGGISPENYAATLNLKEVRDTLAKLETFELGGHEIELFEALRARERKLLQETTSPTILNVTPCDNTAEVATTGQTVEEPKSRE
jgi:hypothetical protein